MAFKPALVSKTKRIPVGKLVSSTAKNIEKMKAKYPHYYIVVQGRGSDRKYFYQFLQVIAA